MPTVESILSSIDAATAPGFRGELIARGQARSMIWRDGVLPPNAPAFAPQLSYDLHSYAYSLLELALRLRELGGDPARARQAFEQAATALEAVMVRGARGDSDRDFHFVMAAASYHLARMSARAYSLLTIVRAEENFSPLERALAQLMLRDIDALQAAALEFRLGGAGSDEAIRAGLVRSWERSELSALPDDDGSSFLLDGMDLALTDNFFAAISTFLLALEHGSAQLLAAAVAKIDDGVATSADLNMLPQWWAYRITRHLLTDLWDCSFHERLPRMPRGGEAGEWASLRDLFIAVLFRRPRAELDLWPSQLTAAERAVDQNDDLVVSLPTSAGKTRISELCILRCLAAGRRVVFVTPLRALSAQTETTLQRTFGCLGKSISALYGSIGVSGFDEDAIRQRHIVVATPEKLDFALRNDPSLLDDVGLLVFDEGHMIGLNEREVRYERPDTASPETLRRRPTARGLPLGHSTRRRSIGRLRELAPKRPSRRSDKRQMAPDEAALRRSSVGRQDRTPQSARRSRTAFRAAFPGRFGTAAGQTQETVSIQPWRTLSRDRMAAGERWTIGPRLLPGPRPRRAVRRSHRRSPSAGRAAIAAPGGFGVAEHSPDARRRMARSEPPHSRMSEAWRGDPSRRAADRISEGDRAFAA
ncbi:MULTISPECIES: DEAD/DEAH box helicase [unclassified Bradyrhizobium]|uniref:DEAD/DEAH box helicase n=1 Tax=unclassified Bradyrhizobium TaxID=2631580 RepID=UPI0028E28592|nr:MULTISPECIES: DEAD/DEAH box helicase [unclassified Bradyrhizobium]